MARYKGRLNSFPKCNDSRECFAKQCGKCSILEETYQEDRACAFCKPDYDVTKGKVYPWDENYGKRLKKAK